MVNLEKSFIYTSSTIKDAVQAIEQSGAQIALVVNHERKLLGTVTDGDVRRGLIKGVGLDCEVTEIMNSKPVTLLKNSYDMKKVLEILKGKSIKQVPVLDEQGIVATIETAKELGNQAKIPNIAILMAGGRGERLLPLTKATPKPLLSVGGQPILKTIIEKLKDHGFYKFYVSVNYKAQMIEAYLGAGDALGVEIEYLKESQRLGTAGAVSLLDQVPNEPVLLMNADLLTNINFEQLLDFHLKEKADLTMCVREYDFQVPYGVVQLAEHKVLKIDEKPIQRFFVNAGVYILNPETIALIPKNEFFDMPMLVEKMISQNKSVSAFPIREFWLDIGQIDDYHKANTEFSGSFE